MEAKIMNRKLLVKYVQKLFVAISCFILLGAAMSAMTGCNKRARAENERENKSRISSKAGGVGRELTGTWQKIQAGGAYAEYARYAENLGNFETLEITADGRVRRATLIAAKIYDCPVEDSTISEGAIVVESETALNITLDVGTLEHREGCSPAKNFTAPTKATTTDFGWKLGKNESGADELCLTEARGETACYRRAE
jgi:hypothetical protein